jgi:Flp pilus assembly protein TadG
MTGCRSLWRRDDGRVTIFFAIIASAWVAMLGLIIVGGGRVRAYQKADNVASEAARAGANVIDPGLAIPGGAKLIDPNRARAAALAYLAAAGATGVVSVAPDRRHITVTATVTYTNPSGLEFLGGHTWQATGQATATLLIG